MTQRYVRPWRPWNSRTWAWQSYRNWTAAEQVAMVGYGYGGHLLLDHSVRELADFTGPVELGVIGAAVQIDERVFRHGLL
jgi:hypothetical protein